MSKSIFTGSEEDFAVNKTIYQGSVFHIDSISGAFSMANSLIGLNCYNLGDITKLNIKNVKDIAYYYKLWLYEKNIHRELPDNFEIFMVREVTKTLYNYGLALSCSFDTNEPYLYYPVDYLLLDADIKEKLFKNNIFYIGNILERSYSDLDKLLNNNLIDLEAAIYNSVGIDALNKFLDNSISRAEKHIDELKKQLVDIKDIVSAYDELLDLNYAVRREKARLFIEESNIDQILDNYMEGFGESSYEKK